MLDPRASAHAISDKAELLIAATAPGRSCHLGRRAEGLSFGGDPHAGGEFEREEAAARKGQLDKIGRPPSRRLGRPDCEYAIAVASEFAAISEYNDPTDPIVDIRETMNRMAISSARLYESN